MNQRKRPRYSALKTLLLGAVLVAVSAAADPQAAGVIKRVDGNVTVTRGTSLLTAQVGMPVYPDDHVTTGPGGGASITFEDDTLLSLGPDAELDIDRFVFDATTYDGAFEITLDKGKLAVVSGKIAKHREDAMKVRTPSSVLGVRGTEFVVEVGDKR